MTYADDSLRFCLNDGANLIEMSEPAATVQMSFDKNPMRVSVAPDSVPTYFPPTNAPPTQTTRKGISLIFVGFLGVLFLLTVGAFAVFVFFNRSAEKPTPIVAASPTPTAAPTATPSDETAKLKEELANLQKQVQNQKNQKSAQPVEKTSAPSNGAPRTARADSPRDGFLALRSEPSSETGYRIAQIPHGAQLTVLACPRPSNVGKMPGRWCQVVYNGQAGWAFDGFMTF